MPERENNGRKTIEEVQRLRARVAKLERIALRKAGPKDADRELDRAWGEWETTFDAIGDSVILLDSEFNIVQANAATSNLLGKPLDEIVGQTCCKLVHGSDEPLENCPLIKAKTTKKREKAELYIAEKGIWVLVSVDPILDEQGNLTGAVHITRDITERKKAEEALKEQRDVAQRYLDLAGVMFVAIDAQENVTLINRKGCEILGYDDTEVVGKNWFDNFVPERLRKTVKGVSQALLRGEVEAAEYWENLVLTKSGEERIIAWHNTLLTDEGGNIIGHLSSGEDITERKKAEEMIESLAKFPAENPYPVLRITKEGEILYSNEAGKLLLMHWNSKVGKTVPEKWRSSITEAFRSKKTKTEEEKVEDRIFSCVIAPVKDAGYVNLYGRDVTEHKRAEEALAQSEQKYKELFESVREAIIIMDLNGKITDANRIVEEYGHTRDYLLGKSIFDFIPVNHRARAARDFEELCHGTPVKGEMEVIAPKGNLTVEYRDNPIVRGGQIVAVQAILMDITERKKAEEALFQSQKLILDMIDNADLLIYVLDVEGIFILINRKLERILNTKREKLIGKTREAVLPKKIADSHRANDLEVIRKQEAITFEEINDDPDGQHTYLSTKFPILDASGKVYAICGISKDITERKRAEQALRDYQADLKSLASELSLTEERERRRIAAGIHDDIGQKLALAKMELQLLARSPGKSKIPASLDGVCARIDEAIKDAHSLTFELSNPALYDLSFAAAIDLWLLEQIQKKHGIKCTVIADEQAVPLDENSKVVLFRALRELAANVVKHAKATALTVTIEKLENSVQITCKDDGLGFAPPEAGALPRDVGGFGLFNIKERLEYLGGGMKLQSAPGRGTLITLSLPLKRQNDADADEGRQ